MSNLNIQSSRLRAKSESNIKNTKVTFAHVKNQKSDEPRAKKPVFDILSLPIDLQKEIFKRIFGTSYLDLKNFADFLNFSYVCKSFSILLIKLFIEGSNKPEQILSSSDPHYFPPFITEDLDRSVALFNLASQQPGREICEIYIQLFNKYITNFIQSALKIKFSFSYDFPSNFSPFTSHQFGIGIPRIFQITFNEIPQSTKNQFKNPDFIIHSKWFYWKFLENYFLSIPIENFVEILKTHKNAPDIISFLEKNNRSRDISLLINNLLNYLIGLEIIDNISCVIIQKLFNPQLINDQLVNKLLPKIILIITSKSKTLYERFFMMHILYSAATNNLIIDIQENVIEIIINYIYILNDNKKREAEFKGWGCNIIVSPILLFAKLCSQHLISNGMIDKLKNIVIDYFNKPMSNRSCYIKNAYMTALALLSNEYLDFKTIESCLIKCISSPHHELNNLNDIFSIIELLVQKNLHQMQYANEIINFIIEKLKITGDVTIERLRESKFNLCIKLLESGICDKANTSELVAIAQKYFTHSNLTTREHALKLVSLICPERQRTLVNNVILQSIFQTHNSLPNTTQSYENARLISFFTNYNQHISQLFNKFISDIEEEVNQGVLKSEI